MSASWDILPLLRKFELPPVAFRKGQFHFLFKFVDAVLIHLMLYEKMESKVVIPTD